MNNHLLTLKNLAKGQKYFKWYFAIIRNAATREKPDCYLERHHALPKCFGLGGERDKDNLVLLTAKEHFVCHLLLTKMQLPEPYHSKSCYAISAFLRKNKHHQRLYTAKQYETARLIFARNQSRIMQGRVWTEEQKIKLRKPKRSSINYKQNFTGVGTVFITNGIVDKRHPKDVDLPDGFRLGRKTLVCNICNYSASMPNFAKYHECLSQKNLTHPSGSTK